MKKAIAFLLKLLAGFGVFITIIVAMATSKPNDSYILNLNAIFIGIVVIIVLLISARMLIKSDGEKDYSRVNKIRQKVNAAINIIIIKFIKVNIK